jgi:hypothetical protein
LCDEMDRYHHLRETVVSGSSGGIETTPKK